MQEDKIKKQESEENNRTAEADAEIKNEKVKKTDDKHIEKMKKAMEALQKERDTYLDSYQRTFSEFNNFKKRNQAAVSCAIQDGCAETVVKILPVMDNFERALSHVEDSKDKALAEGVLMVYKQLSDILSSMGVKEIPAEGEPFDPNLHQAIQQAPSEEGVAPDTVVQVVQKGYMLGDKILRHSMVIVSK